jgi:hypothetical protein
VTLLRQPDLVGKPSWFGCSHALPARADYALDAADEKIAFVTSVQWLDTSLTTRQIARIHFRTVTITTNELLKVSLQDLDASGDPDGTPDQYRTITPIVNRGLRTGLITSDGTDTGTLRTVSNGEQIAIVIEFDGNTGNLLITTVHSSAFNFGNAYPDAFTAAWAKTANTNQAMTVAIEFADGGFAQTPGLIPFVGHTGDSDSPLTPVTFNSGSTPDERGNVWTPDFSGTASALWAYVDYDNPCDLVLYDSSSNVLATAACPAAAVRQTTTDGLLVLPITPVTVTAGSLYRVAIKPGASNVIVVRWSAFSNAALGAWYGTNYYSTSRVNAGSWTDVDTDVMYCGPVMSAISTSTGGGGSTILRRPHSSRVIV